MDAGSLDGGPAVIDPQDIMDEEEAEAYQAVIDAALDREVPEITVEASAPGSPSTSGISREQVAAERETPPEK
jgi:hypothetical protein